MCGALEIVFWCRLCPCSVRSPGVKETNKYDHEDLSKLTVQDVFKARSLEIVMTKWLMVQTIGTVAHVMLKRQLHHLCNGGRNILRDVAANTYSNQILDGYLCRK